VSGIGIGTPASARLVNIDEVGVHRPVLAAAGLANREDPFDEAVTVGGLGAGARFAPQYGMSERPFGAVVDRLEPGWV
jgi:hypothetical protein